MLFYKVCNVVTCFSRFSFFDFLQRPFRNPSLIFLIRILQPISSPCIFNHAIIPSYQPFHVVCCSCILLVGGRLDHPVKGQSIYAYVVIKQHTTHSGGATAADMAAPADSLGLGSDETLKALLHQVCLPFPGVLCTAHCAAMWWQCT